MNLTRIKVICLLHLSFCAIIACMLGQRGYSTPDEILFKEMAETGDVGYFKYDIWSSYIASTGGILDNGHIIVYYLALIALALLSQSVRGLLTLCFSVTLPTTFYFFSGSLRDPIFFVCSCVLICFSCGRDRPNWPAMAAVLTPAFILRPEYGLILLCSIALSQFNSYALFRFLLISCVSAVLCVVVAMILTDYPVDLYQDFFQSKHGKNLDAGSVLSIYWHEFNYYTALQAITLSWFYFWIYPASGVGSLYDYGIMIENFVFLGLFILVISSRRPPLFRHSWAYRFSLVMLLFSFLFSIFTTTHIDAYRFRLMFVPCLVFLGISGVWSYFPFLSKFESISAIRPNEDASKVLEGKK